jgi:octaheme c-type cytochrome (tetrathionate reductase family)
MRDTPFSTKYSVHFYLGKLTLLLLFYFSIVSLSFAAGFSHNSDLDRKKSTTDHTKLSILQGPFNSGIEVTHACLSCHTQAGNQIRQTTHWTWRFNLPNNDQPLGKEVVVNNFCGSPKTNWKKCTICHIGYGWKDPKVKEVSDQMVDCLICHEQTQEYTKYSYGYGVLQFKGKIIRKPDFSKIAQSVALPRRRNCGQCHFYGGGHDGAKHGDLDSSLNSPDYSVDVHMDADGLNFQCVTCHTAGGHHFTGSRYLMKAVDHLGVDRPGHTDTTRTSCESCHGEMPHLTNQSLNNHTDRVACQTCHIPFLARGGIKTKTFWDWSTAGDKNEKGRPIRLKDEDGYPIYSTQHGSMTWKEDFPPDYYWFNGKMSHTTIFDKLNEKQIVSLNKIGGEASDPQSRIWPFKTMRGKQPFDPINKNFVITHLNPDNRYDKAAFYKSFDWPKAIEAGMKSKDAPVYSGQFDFIETAMYFPITHMVAPKDEALGCNDCHKKNGRLANLSGFYMPGRDGFLLVGRLGWFLTLLTVIGVFLHGFTRLFLYYGEK